MPKKAGDLHIKHYQDLRSIGLTLATDLVQKPPRFNAFWNYTPIPILMREGGFFRSTKTTKVLAGGNASTKTHAGVFEAIMVYTGIVPPSMRNVYAYEESLVNLATGGKNNRPRHARIVVQDYAKHWNMTLKPKLLGSPSEDYCGLLPEEWSAGWDENSHIFTGPDGSQLDIFASDPAEQVDPRQLRGPRLDFIFIDELNNQTVYEECLSRVLGVKGGLGYMSLAYCPQEGYECWTYEKFYKSTFNPSTKKRLPEEDCNPSIFYEKVTPMDNPSVTPEKIADMKASIREWEIAPRIYGEYSHRGDNPFFKIELLEKWEREGRTNEQGEFYEVEIVKEDIDEGEYEGKLNKITPIDAAGHKKQEDMIVWQIWNMPQKNHKYALTADCSAGREGSDYNVADLWDFTTPSRPVQCAQARIKKVKAIEFATTCACMANVYGNCLLIPEANAFGEAFIDTTKNYVNLYVRSSISDKVEDKDMEKYGWNTNKYTKAAMLENLYKLIIQWAADVSDGRSYCPIKSRNTLEELQAFEEKIKRSAYDNQLNRIWGARAGMFDDTVITMAIAMWVGTKEQGKLVTNKEKNEAEKKTVNLHKKLDKKIEDGRSSFSKLRNVKYKKQSWFNLARKNKHYA